MRLPERMFSRRAVLRSGAGVAATVGLSTVVEPQAAATADVTGFKEGPKDGVSDRVRAGRLSANGWPMENGADIGGAVWTRPVAGSDVVAAVHIGEVEAVLLHVIRRFNYEIGTLRAGDVVGFRPPGRALVGYQTNHASGTAVDIRPRWYPVGTKNNLAPHELRIVRAILADCQGIVAWGGDFGHSDEAHFQIDVPPADPRLPKVANRIRAWNGTPGQGAGVVLAGA